MPVARLTAVLQTLIVMPFSLLGEKHYRLILFRDNATRLVRRSLPQFVWYRADVKPSLSILASHYRDNQGTGHQPPLSFGGTNQTGLRHGRAGLRGKKVDARDIHGGDRVCQTRLPSQITLFKRLESGKQRWDEEKIFSRRLHMRGKMLFEESAVTLVIFDS